MILAIYTLGDSHVIRRVPRFQSGNIIHPRRRIGHLAQSILGAREKNALTDLSTLNDWKTYRVIDGSALP